MYKYSLENIQDTDQQCFPISQIGNFLSLVKAVISPQLAVYYNTVLL